MKIIEFSTPIHVGEEAATKVKIAPLLFKRFVDITRDVLAARTAKQKIEPLMLRARIRAQCTFMTAAEKAIPLSEEILTTLPAAAAKLVVPALTFDEGKQGELLSEAADGIGAPIHYRLGAPIKGANGKSIAELEFLCKTFGDLEDVLAGDQPMFQTVDLISGVARPVDGSMLALPSWAIDQITLADGMFIMNKILPRFLE